MGQKCSRPEDLEIVRHAASREGQHHHRGKSSESFLDKDAILSCLGIGSGQVILDAGCGNGYMSKEFLRLVGDTGKVYALDPDESAIAALRLETQGTNLLAMVGDITTATDLPASAFDLIYLSTVFHGFSLEQIKGFEMEAKRLLDPHGRLAIVEIVKRITPFGPPLNIRFSPEELKHALGFKPLTTIEAGEYFYMQLFENRPRG
jgi:ubiquinone/menaquinone biosynthesis C-methylase UbiE